MTEPPTNQIANKLAALIEDQCGKVESILATIGLSPEELSRRAYCVVDGLVTTYFFDGIPIVRTEIAYCDNIAIGTVTKL